MKLYSASSLEDIATLFDRNAREADAQAGATSSVNRGERWIARAGAWRAAAEILRNTELVSEGK